MVTARVNPCPNEKRFLVRPPMWALNGFAVEAGFLGVGEGVFGCEGGVGCLEGWLLASLELGCLFAHGLELLSFAAESADFDGSGFRNEIAHEVIFSRFRWEGRR